MVLKFHNFTFFLVKINAFFVIIFIFIQFSLLIMIYFDIKQNSAYFDI